MSKPERLLAGGLLLLALGACTPPSAEPSGGGSSPSSSENSGTPRTPDAPETSDSSASPEPTTAAPSTPEPSRSTPVDEPSQPGSEPPVAPTTGTTATAEPSTPASGGGSVPVNLTFAAWDAASGSVAVGAYVETSVPGECTLEVSLVDVRLTTTSATVPDVTTTSCGDLEIDLTGQPTGPWQAVVSYSAGSGGISGTSSAQIFEVS